MIGLLPKNKVDQSGLSLVELMIAMALGTLLLGSIVTVFSGSRKSVDLNGTLTQVQESARFALDAIARDVRMAGFKGCSNSTSAKIVADDAPTDNFQESAITGSLISVGGNWVPAAPATFNAPADVGQPLEGTHALSVQFGSPLTYTIEPMAAPDSNIVLQTTESDLLSGDLALISNCQVADIFTITAASGATLQHSADANRNRLLSAPYGQAGELNRPRVMRFEANIYYIGDTQRTNSVGNKIYSLYKQTLPYTNPPIEMIEGVANMKIKLGFRDSEANSNIQFVSPENSAAAAGRIEAVQIGILMQSVDPVLERDDTSTYYLAGVRMAPSGGATANALNSFPSDSRLKLAYNTSVSIRNRR